MKKYFTYPILIFFLVLPFCTVANEGMWQPGQLPQIKSQLSEAGLELNPDALTNLTDFPMGAIVSLGGCSASFVSDQGLVITNHHCVVRSIQHNSTTDNNLLEQGFVAKNHSEELPAAPGSKILVTESVIDVTDQVLTNLSSEMDGQARYEQIESNTKNLIQNCESNESFRCSVVKFHGGLSYFLFKQLHIRDVRLVHVPSKSVGKYGGDIDNWMWPRHTGDYAFYRAYVGPDGKPADYHEDNQPYQPSHHLKTNPNGVKENDYIMLMGYPGLTNRYRTASEIKHTFNHIYPLTIDLMGSLVSVIEANSAPDSEARVKYQSLLAGLLNYEKNRKLMVDSYQKGTTQQRKDALDRNLREWVAADPKRHSEFGASIDHLDQLIKQHQTMDVRDILLRYMTFSSMIDSAIELHRLAVESTKPDEQREMGFQERDLRDIKQRMLRISGEYDSHVDQAILMVLLERYAELPEAQRLPSIDGFFGIEKVYSAKDLSKKLQKMYEKTKLHDEDIRLGWIGKTLSDFESSKDPFIQFAVQSFADRIKLENQEKERTGLLSVARPVYMKAIIAYNESQGQAIYADANGTLRLTYGHVTGYQPKDGLIAQPFTTLQGVLEKYTGVWPFNAPQSLLDLIENQTYGDYVAEEIQSVPVNFLGNLDITGGNSGSATLNSKAELVGLVFDGVSESIIGNWDYDAEFNRSIHVDIRYILWVMKYLYQAEHLIKEMDLIN